MLRHARLSLAATISVVAFLALAAQAHAAFGLTGLNASPANPDAGAGSQFNVAIGFSDAGEDVKNLVIDLPPGLIGNPTAQPTCTESQLAADACPPATQIGTTTTSATAYIVIVPVPLTIDGSVYNVVPRAGEPARLGIVLRPLGGLLPKLVLQSGASLRPSDLGLRTALANLPNVASGIPIDITAINLSLSGTFMRNPTSCGTKTTNFAATSHANPGTTVTGQASWESVNCAALEFTPEFTGRLGADFQTTAGTRPPATTTIAQAATEAGLKKAQVTMPLGVSGESEYLDNVCSVAQFTNDAGACPDASKVGLAEAATPLLAEPLQGPLILIDNAGLLPRLGLDLRGALPLQIYGDLELIVTPEGLFNMVTFDNLPDIPISNFELAFAPNRLIAIGRDICVPPDLIFQTTFLSHAGGQVQSSVAGTPEGCDSVEPPVVKPTATLTLKKALTKPVLTVTADDGSQPIARLNLKVPKKLTLGEGSYVAKADGVTLPETAIKRNGAKLRVAVTGGTAKLSLKLSKGALMPKPALRKGAKLKFPMTITDVEGTKTKLPQTVRAR